MNENSNADLDAEVRDLLDARRGEWPAVVMACDVSHSWISKFVRGHIDNPGHQTLKRLRAYLASGAEKQAA